MNRRTLSNKELEILNVLLSQPFQGSDKLKNQLADSKAENTGDDDNYGSIRLFTESRDPANVNLRVPVEGLTYDIDDIPINILLHVVNGFINELEIVKLDGSPIHKKIEPSEIKVILNNDDSRNQAD